MFLIKLIDFHELSCFFFGNHFPLWLFLQALGLLQIFETISIGGCGGQPLCSKSILKVVSQMAKPTEHIHAPFLTQMTVLVRNLGFQNMTIMDDPISTSNFVS